MGFRWLCSLHELQDCENQMKDPNQNEENESISRVFRGGDNGRNAEEIATAYRLHDTPDCYYFILGFRIVRNR